MSNALFSQLKRRRRRERRGRDEENSKNLHFTYFLCPGFFPFQTCEANDSCTRSISDLRLHKGSSGTPWFTPEIQTVLPDCLIGHWRRFKKWLRSLTLFWNIYDLYYYLFTLSVTIWIKNLVCNQDLDFDGSCLDLITFKIIKRICILTRKIVSLNFTPQT